MRNSIYNLSLGETTYVEDELYTRVPGGWIVTLPNGESVFVPYNEEFKP